MGQMERLNPQGKHTTVSQPADAKDRFGRSLRAGDTVLVRDTPELIYRVDDVTPNVDPKLPPNTVSVSLSAHRRFIARSGSVLTEITRVRTAEELGLPEAAPASMPVRPWWRRLVRG